MLRAFAHHHDRVRGETVGKGAPLTLRHGTSQRAIARPTGCGLRISTPASNAPIRRKLDVSTASVLLTRFAPTAAA